MKTKRKPAQKPKRRKLVFGKDYHGWMLKHDSRGLQYHSAVAQRTHPGPTGECEPGYRWVRFKIIEVK